MKCPGFQRLIDFLDGQLAGEEADQVNRHLGQGCAACLRDREWYDTVKSIARTDDVFSPAPWVRKRAVDLFAAERKPGRLISSVEAVARLMYDSLQRLQPAGARPAEVSGRQLIYNAAGYNIDIQLAVSSEVGADVMGQILREQEVGFASVAGLLVDLSQNGCDIWSTTTSGFGEFMMHGVDFGRYNLRIETGEAIITIEHLQV